VGQGGTPLREVYKFTTRINIGDFEGLRFTKGLHEVYRRLQAPAEGEAPGNATRPPVSALERGVYDPQQRCQSIPLLLRNRFDALMREIQSAMQILPLLSLSLVIGLNAALPATAADWPQFRGPDRTDRSSETGLLKQWPAEGPKQAWVYKNAGSGYSGPAIVGGKLFTMGSRGDMDTLIALDANTGKELWQTEIGAVFKQDRGDGPRGTPAVDGGRVYAMTGRGDVVCAQTADGKVVWTRTIQDLGGGKRPNWGFSESVLLDGDHIICTPGGATGTVAALDKKTGKTVWRTTGFTDDADYASVMPIDVGGKRQLVQITQKTVVGIDPQGGKVLWRSEWPGKTAVIPTPVYKDGHVYVSSGYGVGCKLIKLGPGGEASDVYQNKNMANHHGGVILVGDHLYGHAGQRGNEPWVCQNFKTGDIVWSSTKLGKGAVTFAEGMLYCVDETTREVVLVEASPKAWTEHGRFKPSPAATIRARDDKMWTHPVVCDGKLYLRDMDIIYCYVVKK
jgi:outer membrane protein assembly factor BamB